MALFTVVMAVLEFVVPAFFMFTSMIAIVMITQRDVKPVIPLILDCILTVPEFFHLTKLDKIMLVVCMAIVLISIIWFFVSTFGADKKKFVLGKLFWGLIAVAVIGAGLSGLLCPEYEHIYSLRFLGILVAIILIYLILINGTDESVKDYTAYTFMCYGIVACLLIAHFYATVDNVVQSFYNKALRVGFAVTNTIAPAIGVCIPATIYLATKKRPSIFLPFVFLMYIGVWFTFSRAGILCSTIILPIALIYGFIVSKNKAEYGITTGVCVAIILSAVLLLKDDLAIWFQHTKELGLSNNGRFDVWKYGWEDFKRNKIFGAGFYGEDGINLEGPLKKFHNTILQILACSGVVGFVAFAFHYFQRYKLMFKKLSIYRLFWLFSLAIYEGCAMLDNGTIMFFSQIMLTLIFTTCEKESGGVCMSAFEPFKKHKKENLNDKSNEVKNINSNSFMLRFENSYDDESEKTEKEYTENSQTEVDAVKNEKNEQVEQIVKQIESINAESTPLNLKSQENQFNANATTESNSDHNADIQTQEMSDKELTKKHKFYRYFLKRFFDIILSLIAMIILSPVYLIVSIMVRIKLGKPVIFKQLRVGKDGKIMNFIKFRSMSDKVDKDGVLLPDAQRLTKLGKILRKTSIDELPQLALVFIGKMSLIGPRPRDIKECVFLNETQSQRHLVRPGITGWAQCHGRNNLIFAEVCDYDRYYVENCSLWLDIKTIFLTIKTVLKKEGINGQVQQSNNFSEYHGDYLLRTGKITEEEYISKLSEAKELERIIMEKN